MGYPPPYDGFVSISSNERNPVRPCAGFSHTNGNSSPIRGSFSRKGPGPSTMIKLRSLPLRVSLCVLASAFLLPALAWDKESRPPSASSTALTNPSSSRFSGNTHPFANAKTRSGQGRRQPSHDRPHPGAQPRSGAAGRLRRLRGQRIRPELAQLPPVAYARPDRRAVRTLPDRHPDHHQLAHRPRIHGLAGHQRPHVHPLQRHRRRRSRAPSIPRFTTSPSKAKRTSAT